MGVNIPQILEKRQIDGKFNNETKFKKKFWPQVLAAFAANLGAFAFGTVLAWSSTGIPSLQKSNELGDLTSEAQSWIGAIATLGAVCACPFAGYGLSTYGRRKVMLYLTIPLIFGWLLIALAPEIDMIYAGRFITGFCGGAFSLAAPVFTAETSDDEIRGGLGTLFDLLMSLGMFYIYGLGMFLQWRHQAMACAVVPVIFHILMYFVPESPRFLIEVEKQEKAEKAVEWLKHAKKTPHVVHLEIAQLSKSVEEMRTKSTNLKEALDPSIVKPTLLMLALMFFTTFSGIDAVFAYTVNIFAAAKTGMDPSLSTLIIGVVTVVGTLPVTFIVDSGGRKMFLILSGFGMAFSLVTMGAYFYISEQNLILFGTYGASELSWLPLTALVAFIVTYSLGFGPISMMMIGEILPNYLKGMTSCLVLCFRWFLAFTVTFSFSSFQRLLQNSGTFWMFALVCFTSIFFVIFLVPETKGKSLDEIQQFFASKPILPQETCDTKNCNITVSVISV